MMSIYKAIVDFKTLNPVTENDVQIFLNTLSVDTQKQLICAMYLGRDHIHFDSFQPDTELNVTNVDHISQNEFARILFEKGRNVLTYFEAVERCAANEDFDLNNI